MPIDDNKDFIRFSMAVSDEFALEFGQLEMVVVHLSHYFGRPMIRELGEFLRKVDGCVVHCMTSLRKSMS